MLRRVLPVPVTLTLVRLFKALADGLERFGSGRGGMSVMVQVGQERRWWRLLAEDGDGPFIPAVPARALLRRQALPVGAGPALCVVSLAEAEAAMGDLRVVTERAEETVVPIFPRVLGEAFARLPDEIQATHVTADCSRWAGRSAIERGTGLWERGLAALFGFPAAAGDVAVEVTKSVTPRGEIWVRQFGGKTFRSHLAATAAGMTERFGPFTFLLGLKVEGGRLYYPVVRGRLGPLPLPRWLLPLAEASERVEDGRFCFDVAIFAPLTRRLFVRYRGWRVAA